MEILTGVFETRKEAENAIKELKSQGVPDNRLGLVTPGGQSRGDTTVTVTDTEHPGMGTAMGAAVGGAMGAAGGATLGLAAATLVIPGVGPVLAFGLIGAALLGGTGAAIGAALGDTLEGGLGEGLPHEDVYLYEDALRHGRSIVIVHDEGDEAAKARALFNRSGALDVDRLRESWWSELRDNERSDYASTGRDFDRDELSYRKGFEAALHPHRRGKSYSDAEVNLREAYGDDEVNDAFRCGYERGCNYHASVTEIRGA